MVYEFKGGLGLSIWEVFESGSGNGNLSLPHSKADTGYSFGFNVEGLGFAA